MSYKSNQDVLMEMIENNFPSLHQYALYAENFAHPVRKVYYMKILTSNIKYPDVWDCNYMKIASSKNYRDYMKSIIRYVKDNQDLITFMEL